MLTVHNTPPGSPSAGNNTSRTSAKDRQLSRFSTVPRNRRRKFRYVNRINMLPSRTESSGILYSYRAMSRWPLVLGILASLFVCIRASSLTSPIFINMDKRFKVWPPVRAKKELDEMDDARMARERLANGQMLKQPLLRFDILWRKFSGKRRQFTV